MLLLVGVIVDDMLWVDDEVKVLDGVIVIVGVTVIELVRLPVAL